MANYPNSNPSLCGLPHTTYPHAELKAFSKAKAALFKAAEALGVKVRVQFLAEPLTVANPIGTEPVWVDVPLSTYGELDGQNQK